MTSRQTKSSRGTSSTVVRPGHVSEVTVAAVPARIQPPGPPALRLSRFPILKNLFESFERDIVVVVDSGRDTGYLVGRHYSM